MKSIAIKIWLGFMGFLAITMAGLALCLITWLEPAYEKWFISTTQITIAQEFSDMQVDVVTAATRLENLYRGQILIVSKDQGILYRSDMLPNAQTIMHTLESIPWYEQQNGMQKVLNPRTNITYDLIWQNIGLNHRGTYAFVVVPEQSLSETTRFMLRQFVLIALILIPVGGILALFIARLFSKPIRHIQKVSSKLAEGKLETRAVLKSSDEIGLLSNSINDLASKLQKVEVLRRELFDNMSHDLQTPLSIIQGYAEILQDVSGADETLRGEHTNVILSETAYMKKLVNDMRDYAYLQSEMNKPQYKSFDFSALAESICPIYALTAEKNGVSYHYSIEPNLSIFFDEERMSRVLHNILQNAFNYVNQGGSVSVCMARSEGNRLEIENTVSNSLSAEELEHLFERYYRKQNGSNTGTGLGLAIVKSILDSGGFTYGIINKSKNSVCFYLNF